MTYAKTTPRPRRPREEAVRLGKAIYERDILPQVEAGHFGEYVAIDIESGDWAIAQRHARRGWSVCGRGAPTRSTSCASASGTGRCGASGPEERSGLRPGRWVCDL